MAGINRIITHMIANVIFGHAVSNIPRPAKNTIRITIRMMNNSDARIHQYSIHKFLSMVTFYLSSSQWACR